MKAKDFKFSVGEDVAVVEGEWAEPELAHIVSIPDGEEVDEIEVRFLADDAYGTVLAEDCISEAEGRRLKFQATKSVHDYFEES